MTQQGHYPILVADFDDFVSSDPIRVQRFVKTLGRGLEEIGFFALKNHRINRTLIEQIYKLGDRLFAQPQNIKQQYEIPGLLGQRGYVGLGR